ncbi:hypothetical protein cypCar_00024987 [Cyprinus carpio]|nr:hypothetical protein cypCar_00024987 [Cyprinus carpio]
MEGDSVTLHTDLMEICEDEDILWQFGAEKILVAEKNGEIGNFSTYDVTDGRFRDRLKLDNKTGSLTITNITTEHAGVYELDISGEKLSSKTFSVSVYASALEVEYQDKNSYSCVINNPISNQTQHLDITQLCHTCAVQTCEEEITYTDPKFCKRNAHKLNFNEEGHVEYVPVAMRNLL